jgi:Protein of unknown function (DUF3891)
VLLREDEGGWIAIGQPSHAWISAQLARAWGNDEFGAVDSPDEVCLAAAQHDVGWATRDLDPIFNPETGLPRSFMEMPLGIHLGIFTDGPRSIVSQSRYAALLVSMHGSRLYARRDLDRLSAEDRDAVRAFLADQRAFQQELIGALDVDPAEAERNSLLIWTWDYVSLAVCLDWAPATARGCPTAAGTVDLQITPGPEPGIVRLEPWPFDASSLTVHCEGRRLRQRYEDEESMRADFTTRPWETLEFRLMPR